MEVERVFKAILYAYGMTCGGAEIFGHSWDNAIFNGAL